MRKKILSIVAIMALSGAAALAGNTGILRVVVAEGQGVPSEGAIVTVTDPTGTVPAAEQKTDKRGRAAFLGLVSMEYQVRVQKAGFQAYEFNFRSEGGKTEERKVDLLALGAGVVVEGEGAEAKAVVRQKDLWAVAYNEGAELYRQDRDQEALAKADEALALKPDFAPALLLKGLIEEEHGTCAAAIPLLKRAHEAEPAPAGLSALVRCLDKSGDAAEAERYRKLLQAAGRSKADLYNEAVLKLNAGDDAAAAPLLEQAIGQDAAFAQAQYQYGLILFRRGEIPKALEKLELYLKLAPSGEFAADAKSLLAALKP